MGRSSSARGRPGGSVDGASAEGHQMRRCLGPQPLHSAAGAVSLRLGRSEWRLLSPSPAVILPEVEEGVNHLLWPEVRVSGKPRGLRCPVLSTAPQVFSKNPILYLDLFISSGWK